MKCKRLPIPQKVIRQLQDQRTPLIDRVILAQAIRTEYDHSALYMSEVIGINEAMYHKLCKIAESQCDELIDRVRNNTCSVRLALQLLNEDVQPGTIDWEKHFGYLFISRIKELEKYEIIYKGRTNILYRTDDGVFLGVTRRNNEKCCRLDDTPVIIDAIRSWLIKGGFVRWEANQFILYTPQSEKYGKLANYIVGLTIKQPFRSVKRLRISYKDNHNQDISDLISFTPLLIFSNFTMRVVISDASFLSSVAWFLRIPLTPTATATHKDRKEMRIGISTCIVLLSFANSERGETGLDPVSALPPYSVIRLSSSRSMSISLTCGLSVAGTLS